MASIPCPLMYYSVLSVYSLLTAAGNQIKPNFRVASMGNYFSSGGAGGLFVTRFFSINCNLNDRG